MTPLLVAVALGYLLGSIPFGVIVTYIGDGRDIRTIGSGNIGTTNVLRTGRKSLAALTLLGDMLKATVAVLIANHFWGPTAGLAAGAAAFIGHVFPVWLKFRGGKGVATYLGALIGVVWPAALVFAAAWILIAKTTRYSSLSALIASLAAPVAVAIFDAVNPTALVFAGLSALIWAFHRDNIARLLAGEEGRIGQRAAAAEEG